MTSLKGSIALICTIGFYAVGPLAYGASDLQENPSQNVAEQASDQENSITSAILSFFGAEQQKKDVGPEAILIENPAKENADQYITLSESSDGLNGEEPGKRLTVTQSYTARPSLVFNMGSSGLSSVSPAGFAGSGATVTGQNVTFSYGNAGLSQNPRALDITLGSQFLVEPSSIMSPLFDGSEFDQANMRQAYNLSVDMAYAGFKLGASFGQEKMLYDAGLKGFDVGLGYVGRKWGADVKFGEYKRERDRLFASTEEFYDTVYALEIGAAYQLYSNIRFTGRFTYYSYGQENERDSLKSSQVFFLGTNVNF